MFQKSQDIHVPRKHRHTLSPRRLRARFGLAPACGVVSAPMNPMRRKTRRWASLSLLLLAGCAAAPNPLQFVSGPDPVYPAQARAAGVEGQVTVRYDVTAEGAVANVRVVDATPAGVFEQAALATVAQWRFRPPVVDGRSVSLRDRVSTLRFELGDSDDYAGY